MTVEMDATDLFCGGGGSSTGAVMAGAELKCAINHWDMAIETHNTNFPGADHVRVDVKRLSDHRIRRLFPNTNILIALPECVNHSIAKGAKSRKQSSPSLLDLIEHPELAELGPASEGEAERSHATMNDVCRFVEQKDLAGKPYLGIVVENVVDSAKWGVDNDGRHFKRWLNRIRKVGYDHEVVYLNSMFCPPAPRAVPRSRDRMYVVFWRKGMRRPNLRVEPPSWCRRCRRVVEGRQTWKRPDREPWGRYGPQYFYSCPDCYEPVAPGAAPAASIIDFSIPTPLIGERAKPLKENTRSRIQRGLERLGAEPFELRFKRGRAPSPQTIPLVGIPGNGTNPWGNGAPVVLPVSGNTHETSSGNRARRADRAVLPTVHASLDRALVMANTEHGVPRPAPLSPTQTLRTEGGLALVTRTGHKSANGLLSRNASSDPSFGLTTAGDLALVMGNRSCGVAPPPEATLHPSRTDLAGETFGVVEIQQNGGVRDVNAPVHTVRAGGQHHGEVVVSNYSPGWTREADNLPTGSITTADGHAVVVPYSTSGESKAANLRPGDTITSQNKTALVVPYYTGARPMIARLEPGATLSTRDRLALLVPPEETPREQEEPMPLVVTEEMIDQCGFRMFSLEEISRAMAMDLHPDGTPYVLFGNHRERMKLLGNGVTPPAMRLLIEKLGESLDERGAS